MCGIYILFASAAISDGFGLDGDMMVCASREGEIDVTMYTSCLIHRAAELQSQSNKEWTSEW
jgi:hypothetical protein